MKQILKKQFNKRSEKELQRLIDLFKKEPFFKEKKLQDEDLREIAMKLKFQKCHGMTNVFNYGEAGDKFYIILRGVLSIITPNSTIKDRAVKFKDYQMLLEWKENEFDKKAKSCKREHYDGYQEKA